MHKVRWQLQCIKYLGTRAQLDERPRDNNKDEHRPYNAADSPYRNVCASSIEDLPQAGPGVSLTSNFKRARCYAALCKRLKRPVPPSNSLDSAVAKKANAFLTDYPPLGASFK